MSNRTRRVALDQSDANLWTVRASFQDLTTTPYFVIPGINVSIDIGGKNNVFNTVTVWAAGIVSLGNVTQDQIDFMARGIDVFPNLAQGNPGFPGVFYAVAYTDNTVASRIEAFDYAYGLTDYPDPAGQLNYVPAAFVAFGNSQDRNVPQIIFGADGFTIFNNALSPATIGYSVGSVVSRTTAGAIDFDAYPGFLTQVGGSGIDTLNGTSFGDLLIGNGGDDVINALGGNDEVNAGAGADRVDAGTGDDLVDPGTGADLLDGGTGRDTVTFASALAGATVSLTDGRAQIAGDALKTLTGFEDVFGSQFADTLAGDNSANRIEGSGGNDVIRGLGGDDTLLGGAGNDTIMPGTGRNSSDGGAGIDLLDVSDLTAGVIIDLNVGAFWNGTFTQASLNFENATGTAFNDAIYGQETGGNVIDGGTGGADMLFGGGGGGDVVSYASNPRGVLIDFAEQLSFDGIALDQVIGFEEAIGTAFNDSIFGTATQVVDPGSGGVDRIVNAALLTYNSNARSIIIDLSVGLSFDGVDLDSFVGIRAVRGSRFDDDIFGSERDDSIDGGAGFDRLLGGGGNDTFILRRGEADGDLIRDFTGNGAAAGDRIQLSGYSAGSTFTKLAGNSTTWLVTDAASGAVDVVRIFGDLHSSDWAFVG